MLRKACSSRESEYHITQDHCYLENSATKMDSIKIEHLDFENSSRSQLKIQEPDILSGNKNDSNYAVTTTTPQIVYLPSIENCTEHSDLFLHDDEKLVKPGDKFDSHRDFVQYLNENAKRWYFYYKCSDSRKPNTEYESYLYTCVYLRNKEKYIKKGLRKRKNNIKTNCPCKIKLKHLPNEKQLTVVFVCNHHDHPLCEEEFHKLQHGRRLPPYIKEEIMDLLTLQVEMDKIRKYVQIQTGFSMNHTFFYQIEKTMRLKNLERQVSDKKLMELSKKISMVDNLSSDEEKYPRKNGLKRARGLKVKENKRNNNINKKYNKEILDTTYKKLDTKDVMNMQETLESETHKNPWIIDQYVLEPNTVQNEVLNVFDSHNNYYTLNNKYTELSIPEENQTIGDVIDNNYVACETIVTEVNNTFENDHSCLVQNANDELTCPHNYEEDNMTTVDHENMKWIIHDNREFPNEIKELPDNNTEFSGLIHMNNTNKTSHYYTERKEKYNQIIKENDTVTALDDSLTGDGEVQTNDTISTLPLLPVFDVCMKDGNVTRFVANDDILSDLKQNSVDRAVQTNDKDKGITEVSNACDNSSSSEPNVSESYIERLSKNMYQKHEYIHKYNINHYMVRPHFPEYIKMLSQEIQIDVKEMLKNVHSEKAMFKMTTTQRGKEGDTRIWYLTIRFE